MPSFLQCRVHLCRNCRRFLSFLFVWWPFEHRGSSQWEWVSPSWEYRYHLTHISTYANVASTCIAGGYYLFMFSLLDNGVLSSDINRNVFLQQYYIHEYRWRGRFKLHKSVLLVLRFAFSNTKKRSCCTVMLQLFLSVHSCEGPNHCPCLLQLRTLVIKTLMLAWDPELFSERKFSVLKSMSGNKLKSNLWPSANQVVERKAMYLHSKPRVTIPA